MRLDMKNKHIHALVHDRHLPAQSLQECNDTISDVLAFRVAHDPPQPIGSLRTSITVVLRPLVVFLLVQPIRDLRSLPRETHIERSEVPRVLDERLELLALRLPRQGVKEDLLILPVFLHEQPEENRDVAADDSVEVGRGAAELRVDVYEGLQCAGAEGACALANAGALAGAGWARTWRRTFVRRSNS